MQKKYQKYNNNVRMQLFCYNATPVRIECNAMPEPTYVAEVGSNSSRLIYLCN